MYKSNFKKSPNVGNPFIYPVKNQNLSIPKIKVGPEEVHSA
jgi:hypothetical protein